MIKFRGSRFKSTQLNKTQSPLKARQLNANDFSKSLKLKSQQTKNLTLKDGDLAIK